MVDPPPALDEPRSASQPARAMPVTEKPEFS
jgi:hypothetical protein